MGYTYSIYIKEGYSDGLKHFEKLLWITFGELLLEAREK